MKKIEVKKWKATNSSGEEVMDSNVNLIDFVLTVGSQKEQLLGFSNMRKFRRVSKALDDSEEEGVIELDDEDLELIQSFIEKYSPASWGRNENIMAAVNELMEVE